MCQQHAGSRIAQAADYILPSVTLGPAAAAGAQSRSGASSSLVSSTQAVATRRQLIAFSRVMLGPAASAAVQSRSGALLIARQQLAGSCNAQAAERILTRVTLGPAAVAVVQSRSGALRIMCQRHAGSRLAQAADRILTCDAWLCRFGCRSVSLWRIADHVSAACRQSSGAGS